MSECKTFHHVNQAIFDRVKKSSTAEHGTVYDPPSGDSGIATTKTIVGTVVLSFVLNPNNGSITYRIVSKPRIISASQIFDGIENLINSVVKK